MPKMSWGTSPEEDPPAVDDRPADPNWIDRLIANLQQSPRPRGPRLLRDPSLQAQARAGEEDQSHPGWDSFP